MRYGCRSVDLICGHHDLVPIGATMRDGSLPAMCAMMLSSQIPVSAPKPVLAYDAQPPCRSPAWAWPHRASAKVNRPALPFDDGNARRTFDDRKPNIDKPRTRVSYCGESVTGGSRARGRHFTCWDQCHRNGATRAVDGRGAGTGQAFLAAESRISSRWLQPTRNANWPGHRRCSRTDTGSPSSVADRLFIR